MKPKFDDCVDCVHFYENREDICDICDDGECFEEIVEELDFNEAED